MCLILFAHKVHLEFPLIVTANRDEFYARPTEPANWWTSHPDLLGGRDLIGGGSWFGVNRNGDFAALTNIREPEKFDKEAPSRGPLVTNYLLERPDPLSYFDQIKASGNEYNGFNLLISQGDDLYYYSNRSEKNGLLEPGIYGLSNYLLDTPWPKVTKGKNKLESMIGNSEISIDHLFTGLSDKGLANDEELPSTGVPQVWEKALSAMYIEMENYGTRCSTVLLKNNQEEIYFEERSFVPDENISSYKFSINQEK